MRHFMKLAEGIDVLPLAFALRAKKHLWNQNTLRTAHPQSPHQQVDDIWLRFQDTAEYEKTGSARSIVDGHESINYPALAELPQARSLIFSLMARVEGERLGRCLITRVPPGHVITPHVDGGDHAAYYERFHIVLQSCPEALFRAEDEVVYMAPGECWWFDNGQEHEVWNEGSVDRVHLIVDIHTGTI